MRSCEVVIIHPDSVYLKVAQVILKPASRDNHPGVTDHWVLKEHTTRALKYCPATLVGVPKVDSP